MIPKILIGDCLRNRGFFSIGFAIILLGVNARAADNPIINETDKKDAIAILKSASPEKIAKYGDAIFPYFLELAEDDGTSDLLRSRIFLAVCKNKTIDRTRFVAAAATHLPKTYRFAGGALEILVQSKDIKHAPLICDYLFTAIDDDRKDNELSHLNCVKAVMALGTTAELKRMENWLIENAPKPGPEDKIWNRMHESTVKLRNRLNRK